MSAYLSIDYLFSSGGTIAGKEYLSDTAVVQKYLLLPYWFWGSLIISLSIICFYFSMRVLLQKNDSNQNVQSIK
jgi:hypothetical protein